MPRQLVSVVLLVWLLMAMLSPFAALSALMLLGIGSLVYAVAASMVRALLEPSSPPNR